MPMSRCICFLILIHGIQAKECRKNYTSENGVIDSRSDREDYTVKNGRLFCFYAVFPIEGCTIRIKTVYRLDRVDELRDCSEYLSIDTKNPTTEKDEKVCANGTATKYYTAMTVEPLMVFKNTGNSFIKVSYSTCWAVLTDSSGTITSEGFKVSELNNNSLKCKYELQTSLDTHSTLVLYIHHVDLTPSATKGTDCSNAFVVEDNATQLLEICNNIKDTETYIIPTGYIDILYNVINLDNKHARLNASYEVISQDQLVLHSAGRNGSFSPRLFHGKYANLATYTFHISSNISGKIVVFLHDVEMGDDCGDIIELLDIPGRENSSKQFLCSSNASSKAMITDSDSGTLQFTTNSKTSGKGFKVSWSTCGGSFMSVTDTFWSPGYYMNGNNPEYFTTCTYNVDVLKATNIYLKINGSGFPQILKENKDLIKLGNALMVQGARLKLQYSSEGQEASFIARYLACPHEYSVDDGQFEINRKWTDLIPQGQTCDFIVRNKHKGNVKLTLMITSCGEDQISVLYNNGNHRNINILSCNTSEMTTVLMVQGDFNISYAAIGNKSLSFYAQFSLVTENEINENQTNIAASTVFTKNIFELIWKSDLFIPVSVAIVVFIFCIVLLAAYISYRKKKSASHNTVWLTDKSTFTHEKAFDHNKVYFDDGRADAPEIVIGLGEYAEIKLPKKRNILGDIIPTEVIQCPTTQERSVTSFSLKRKISSAPDSNALNPAQSNVSTVPNAYSTPWDAQKEKEKIIRVMSLKCPPPIGLIDHENITDNTDNVMNPGIKKDVINDIPDLMNNGVINDVPNETSLNNDLIFHGIYHDGNGIPFGVSCHEETLTIEDDAHSMTQCLEQDV